MPNWRKQISGHQNSYQIREIPEMDRGPAFSLIIPEHCGQNCIANKQSAHQHHALKNLHYFIPRDVSKGFQQKY